MDPNTGDVFRLRAELLLAEHIGDQIDVARLHGRVAQLADATDEERAAAERPQLVAISEQAARRLQLGERELARRRRRRKTERQARKRNR